MKQEGLFTVLCRYVRRYEGWPEKASITSEKGHPLKFADANFPTSRLPPTFDPVAASNCKRLKVGKNAFPGSITAGARSGQGTLDQTELLKWSRKRAAFLLHGSALHKH